MLTPVPLLTAGEASARPGIRVAIATLGCKLNQADSDRLAEQFAAAGYTVAEPDSPADVFILNTCTVTHIAESKARQELRAARRRLPEALLVATGCYVQRDPAATAALPEVDLVAGNDRKGELVALVGRRLASRAEPESLPADQFVPQAPAPASGRTRVFLAIQEGCNDVCSYCIVPRVRGRSRSRPPLDLIGQINDAVAAGVREVVLTGTQLGDYGLDQPRRRGWTPLAGQDGLLPQLLRRILEETSIERLRVSSLQPQDITPQLLQTWRDPRLCRHFHLPLQSASDRVLAAMRRRYHAAGFRHAVAAARAEIPGVAITTDVLAGFPGEDEEDFLATLEFCRELEFAALHVFPFSPRAGTAAQRSPDQIAESVKRERAARLRDLGAQLSAGYRRSLLGSVTPVLWERPAPTPDGELASGLTDTHVRVFAAAGSRRQGDITPVALTRLHRDGVWGEPA